MTAPASRPRDDPAPAHSGGLSSLLGRRDFLTRPACLLLGLCLVALLGVLDFITGTEVSLSILYLLPIAAVTWFAGWQIGLLVALASAASALLTDVLAGATFTQPFIPWWNACVRLAVYAVLVALLSTLRNTLDRLQTALGSVKTLTGLLPICPYCKNVRDDTGYWKEVETYVSAHSHVTFLHGVCPQCERVFEPGDPPAVRDRPA